MIINAGDSCSACEDGTYLVCSTRIDRSLQMRFRYLRCDTCRHRPATKVAIPLSYAPERKRKLKRRGPDTPR